MGPRPQKIMDWVIKNFPPKQVDRAFNDLLAVAAGNREGNRFEKEAIGKIFPDSVFNKK